MTEEKLTASSILSVESDLLRNLSFEERLNEFARLKARKIILIEIFCVSTKIHLVSILLIILDNMCLVL
jgi:hypothetical protein